MFLKSSSFERIIYNPYRNEYYRYMRYSVKGSTKSSYIIIVLDDKLNKLGEIVLPDGYLNTFRFANKDGLVIQYLSLDEGENFFELHQLVFD